MLQLSARSLSTIDHARKIFPDRVSVRASSWRYSSESTGANSALTAALAQHFSFSRLNDAPGRRRFETDALRACAAAALRLRSDDREMRSGARCGYVVYRTEVHFPAD